MTDRQLLALCTMIHSHNGKPVEQPRMTIEDGYRLHCLNAISAEPVQYYCVDSKGREVGF